VYKQRAGEVKILKHDYSVWQKESGVSDNQLENIAANFHTDGLVTSFEFDDIFDVLRIQFPDDFEERYIKYKAFFETEHSGSSMPHQEIIESTNQDEAGIRHNLNHNVVSTRREFEEQNHRSIQPTQNAKLKEGEVPETTTESRFLSTELKEKAAFFIQMSDEGQIILNGKYKLSKPVFGGENSDFIDFCLKYGDRFSVTKSQKAEVFIFKKSPHGILDDLTFRPEIKKIFFPKSTREGIEFRNYLSQEEVDALHINKKKLKTELKGLKQLSLKEMEMIRNGW
jgi:hypothetical protein